MELNIKDKENVCQFEKTALDLKMISRTPLRTPLHDINNQIASNKSMKKNVLSHIDTDQSQKTPTRKTQKIRKSVLVYQDRENVWDQKLNQVAKKEISKIISNAKHMMCTPDVNVNPASASNDKSTIIETNGHVMEQTVENSNQENHETIATVDVLKFQDSDIAFDHEEVYGSESSAENSCIITLEDNVIESGCHSPLHSVDEIDSCKIGTDHTYAGSSCMSCDSGETTTTETQKCSVETITEIPSFSEMGCSPCPITGTEQETMTDPMTPKKAPEMCDASVQHLIDTVTAACSPAPAVDAASVACSPMPTQLADNVDVGSSPIFKSTETTEMSTMTNATPVKHDMSIQAMADMKSVLCSPFCLSTVDCGVSAVSTQVDVTTNTIIVEQMDQGVDVRPMMTAGSTMTEYVMVHSETSMTPVKILNRKGHRITAEEIRKQHPRTLANKLDTYELEAERYKQEIKKMEKERDHMKQQIKELKAAMKDKRKTISDGPSSVVEEKKELKKESVNMINETMSADLLNASHQVQTLSEELSNTKSDLKEANSQKTSLMQQVEELQKSNMMTVDEISGLFEALKEANSLKTSLMKQVEDLQKNDKSTVDSISNIFTALEEAHTLKTSLMKQVVDLHEIDKSTVEEINNLSAAVKEANLQNATQKQDIEDLQKVEQALLQEITFLGKRNQIKETELEDFRQCAAEKEKKLQAKCEMITEENSRLDLLALNLQRTVDSLNEDIDSLENDLFATREFSSEQASRIVKVDEELASITTELNQVKQENMELRDSLAVFRGNQEYLQESLAASQRQLNQKSMEVDEKISELRESSSMVVDLENKMCGLLQGLRNRAGLEPSDLPGLRSTCKITIEQSAQKSVKKSTEKDFPTSARKTCDQSFLSMVIKAVEGQSDSEYESARSSPSSKSSRSDSPYIDGVVPFDGEMSTICEKLKDRDSIEDSPSAVSRNKLGFSRRNSAFAPVRTGTSVIKSKPGPLDSTLQNSILSQSKLEDCEFRLSEQIECIGETFSEIIRCASIIEKASKLSISDLQLENEELSQRLEDTLESQQRVKEDLAFKISELSESEEKLRTLTENVSSLSEKIGVYVKMESEFYVLKAELTSAKTEIKNLEEEKEILTNQLKEVISGCKGSTVSADNYARYHSDITTLKLKIQKLKEQIKQREEYHETLAVKASKRMKTLDENWKKAEEEVYKFDQLVDTIRETIINSGLISKHKESLGGIIRLIDGFDKVPSKPAPLNPIKTTLW